MTDAAECAAYWTSVLDKLKDTTAYKNKQVYDIGGTNDALGGSGFLEAVTQVRFSGPRMLAHAGHRAM